jgi:hypothetical protein
MTTKRAFWLPCECRWLPPLEASQRPRQRPQCMAGPSCWLRADNLAQLPRRRQMMVLVVFSSSLIKVPVSCALVRPTEHGAHGPFSIEGL